MNIQIIGPQIESHSHMAVDIRVGLESKYSWKPDDARLSVFNKLNNVLTVINLGYFLLNTYVSKKDWWKQFQKLDVTEASMSNTVNEFEMFHRIGLVQNLSYCIESSFRIYVRTLDPLACKNGQAEFKSIYDWLLKKLDLQQNNTELLDLLRSIRNTMHNNGLFYPTNGKNQTIIYKANNYFFEVAKPNNFVTTELIVSLIPDLLKLIEVTVSTSPLADIAHIQEIS